MRTSILNLVREIIGDKIKNMMILYFSFVELDVPNACQTHTLGVLRGFGENGCQVDALVPRPKKVRPAIPNVNLYYLWPWRFSDSGRLLIKILAGMISFVFCLFKKYDVIYVRELEVNPFPRWCSIVFRIPLYIEVNGIILQNLQSSGADNKRIKRAESCQRDDFHHAKALIVPSYPRARWIIDHYNLNPNKIHMVINGTDIYPKNNKPRAKAIKKLNLPEEGFYLGYLGTIWEYYDLSCTLKAMKLCQAEINDIFLIIIGGGSGEDDLHILAQEMDLESKLIVLGYIQPDRLVEVMGAIDVGLMNLTKKGLLDLGPVTTRFATYAAYQLPIIASDLYVENYPAELYQGLLLVPPEDSQALADRIIWLYNHPEERKQKAKILYDYVSKELTWQVVVRKIMNIMENDKTIINGER